MPLELGRIGVVGRGSSHERHAESRRRKACTAARVCAGFSSCSTWPSPSKTTSSLPAMCALETAPLQQAGSAGHGHPTGSTWARAAAECARRPGRGRFAENAAPTQAGCLRARSAGSGGPPVSRPPLSGRRRHCACRHCAGSKNEISARMSRLLHGGQPISGTVKRIQRHEQLPIHIQAPLLRR